MTPIARTGVALLILAVLAVAAVGLYFWKRPLDVLARLNRRALAKAGLELATAETAFGRQSYWTGGQGPTLVLLHGAGDQAGTWSGTMESAKVDITRTALSLKPLEEPCPASAGLVRLPSSSAT